MQYIRISLNKLKNNLDKKALIPNKLTKIKMTSPNHLCKEILVLQL